jgi:hypothetical protein
MNRLALALSCALAIAAAASPDAVRAAALQVGKTPWLGAFRGDRMACVPVK